jgi:hypothetical protein
MNKKTVMKAAKNISNLTELNEAIHELKLQKQELEFTIANQWNDLQENYPVLLKNALFQKFPLLKKGNILITLLGIPAIQQNAQKIVNKLAEKAENALDNWIDRLLTKKEKDTPQN